MKNLLLTVLLLLYFASVNSQHMIISDNGRYIQNFDETPFLWIGDTAWELFHKLNREEATYYLKKRAEQGFTIIQAVVLAEMSGIKKPNAYGDLALINKDASRPNEKYFEHVDFIVKKANELGMVIGMLPTWGDKIYSENPSGGPIIFNTQNAKEFGVFLGKRYKSDQIVWILGGDRNPANEEVKNIWRAMAEGLAIGDEDQHLMTYHPRGGSSSSTFWHNEDWLDFNCFQSGHARRFNHVYQWAENDRTLNPAKPTLDGEPAYEAIPVKFWEYCDWSTPLRVPQNVLNSDRLIIDKSYFKEGYFSDYDVRVHAYWDFLSGACGYTYGNNAVWQMFEKGGDLAIPCLDDWKKSLDHRGAQQIIYLQKIFRKYSLDHLVPDQSIIASVNSQGEDHIRAARAENYEWILIYIAKGQPVNVNLGKLGKKRFKAKWFKPSTGITTDIGRVTEFKEFIPPTLGLGNDWLLIFEK